MATQQQTRDRTKRVRDAMQVTVVGVVPEMTVREAIAVLLESSVCGVPVLDPRGKVIGMVSVTDVLQLVAPGGEPFDQYRVRDIMSPVGPTLGPTETLDSAARRMYPDRVQPVLVTEDGVLVGIITPTDILHAL